MKKQFSLALSYAALLVLLVDILLQEFGFSFVLHNMDRNVNKLKRNMIQNTQEVSTKRKYENQTLNGLWKAEDISFEDNNNVDVTFDFRAGNYFIKKVIPHNSKDPILVESGSCFFYDNKLSLLPTSIDDNGTKTVITTLDQSVNKYIEGYTFDLKEDNLTLSNKKEGIELNLTRIHRKSPKS